MSAMTTPRFLAPCRIEITALATRATGMEWTVSGVAVVAFVSRARARSAG